MLRVTNNAISSLAQPAGTNDVQIEIMATDAAKFPQPGAGDWFPVVVTDGTGAFEVMRCVARASGLFTVERAKEGSTARAFPAGARVELRFTKDALESLAPEAARRVQASFSAPAIGQTRTLFYTERVMNFSKLVAVKSGGTSVKYSVKFAGARDTAGTEAVTGGVTVASEDTGEITTAFDNGQIPAQSFVWMEILDVVGVVSDLFVSIGYEAALSAAPVGAVADANAAANTIADNAPAGTGVGITAQAADADAGDTVSYSIDDVRFVIDPFTGVVTRSGRGSLNADIEPTIPVTIYAQSTDGSVSQMTFNIAVTAGHANLLAFPDALDNAAWTKSGVAISPDLPSLAAPDGSFTADQIDEVLVDAEHGVAPAAPVAFAQGHSYRLTAYVRRGIREFRLGFPAAQFGANANAWFNLTTGQLGTVGADITAEIKALDNGWYRLRATKTCTSAGAGVPLFRLSRNATGELSYPGTNSAALYAWRLKCEDLG